MALDPILWALKDAPVTDVYERIVLLVLAEAADDDGCDAYPSKATIARHAKCSEKKVQRVLGSLLQRGLIGRGDQTAAAHIRADRRPTVWDVLIPYAFWAGYPERLDRIQSYRELKGRPPLTERARPRQAPAGERPKRADAGVPRRPHTTAREATPRQDSQSSREKTAGQNAGGLTDPPVDNPHGGSNSPVRGDSQSRTGGLSDPQTTPDPTHNPPHQGGGTNTHASTRRIRRDLAADFLRSLRTGGRRWNATTPPERHDALLDLVVDAWDTGMGNAELRTLLEANLATASNLAAVWTRRLQTRLAERDDHDHALPPPCGHCSDGRIIWLDRDADEWTWCSCHPRGRPDEAHALR